MVEMKQISAALKDMRYSDLERLIGAGLTEGLGADIILKEGLIKAMEEVGERFKAGELFLPELLATAKGMQLAMNILGPKFAQLDGEFCGKVILGTVKGDLHDIGKNIVRMMLEGSGLKVYDLGIDVPAERFVDAVRANNAQVLGMSALLTTTMTSMKEVVEAIVKAGLREKIKIIIGGAPVTQKYAEQIGADGYAPDAILALEKVKSWL